MILRGVAPLAAQSTLQITSPSDGAILKTGQMLNVTVKPPVQTHRRWCELNWPTDIFRSDRI
jgi:hypothetical protein